MPVALAMFQPDIPQNAGTLLRLGACLGVTIHIIHPTGFSFSEARFRRSSMDYARHADLMEHDSFALFHQWRRSQQCRLVLLTTKAEMSPYGARFSSRDVLLVGRESAGVPDWVAESADMKVRVPMRAGQRSLNVALAAALVLGEALRQTDGFADLA